MSGPLVVLKEGMTTCTRSFTAHCSNWTDDSGDLTHATVRCQAVNYGSTTGSYGRQGVTGARRQLLA